MKKYIFSFLLIILVLCMALILRNKTVTVVKAQTTGQYPFGLAGPSIPDDPNKIKELGVKFARESIAWSSIETSDNVYDFSFLDQTGGLLDQLGLELMARIKFGNDFSTTNRNWAVKCDTSLCTPGSVDCPMERVDCPPKDLAANWTDWSSENGYSPLLTDFVTRTLEAIHVRDKNIEYFVIGNEVNTLSFWLGTAEDYLKTRGTIYNAVKRFNAANGTSYKVVDNGIASTIWTNAVAYEAYCRGDVSYAVDFANRAADHTYAGEITADDFKWLNCQDIGGRDYKIMKAMFVKDPNLNEPTFDVMSYHFYEPWDVQEEVINWIRQEMINNGYQPRPIMNTEGGYRDTLHLYTDTPSLEQDVANDILKLHTVAFNKDVKTWLWLPFTERGPEYDAYGYEWKGLIKEDQTPLKAFTSYKTMVAKINGFSLIEKMSGLGASYVYKVNFPDKNPLYVVWDTASKTVNLSSLIAGNVKVTHVDGTEVVTSSQNVSISDSPIYLEAPSATLTLQKQVDKISAFPGETLIYTISYTNSTADNYTNVRIEDPIPSGTTFVSADRGGTSDGTKVVWNVGNLAGGATGAVSFRVVILSPSSVQISPVFSSFYLKEPVSFKVKNTGPTPIALGDSKPWIVNDTRGSLVYDPGGDTSTEVINPGQEIEWRWDQKDSNGNFVNFGNYSIKFNPTGDSSSIVIQNQQGSQGYFTFQMTPGGSQFRVYISRSSEIRKAIEDYYKIGRAHIPMAKVIDDRPGKSPYDSRWSWHFNPDEIFVAEAAIELCDGSPEWVETALDSWAGKTFCPWAAHVSGLE